MTSLAYSKSYDLQDGYSVEFKLDGLSLDCAWSPEPPRGRKAKRLLPSYRRARNDFLGSLGLPLMVVEI